MLLGQYEEAGSYFRKLQYAEAIIFTGNPKRKIASYKNVYDLMAARTISCISIVYQCYIGNLYGLYPPRFSLEGIVQTVA